MTTSPQPHMKTRLQQVLENEDETLKYSTPSFSSSSDSSFVESLDQSPPFSPSTPLKYRGVPFSWEKIPGIAKQYYQSSKADNKTSGQCRLIPPPPPARNPKKSIYQAKKDPFFAAFLECSRDEVDDDCDDDEDDNTSNNVIFKLGSSKITRTLSDRFGLISMYASCKSTCAVSESVVYVPRSRNHPQ